MRLRIYIKFPCSQDDQNTEEETKTESELDIQTQNELLVAKDEPEDYTGAHIIGLTKQKLKQSIQKQDELVGEGKSKKLSKKRKSKHVVNYPSRSKTRATNKLRLNSKALFNPSIKKGNVIVIDDDTVESTEEEGGQSLVTSSHKLKKVKLEPEDEYYNEPVEKQRKDEKGKQIAKHPMRHVTRAAKKLSLNSKALPKSSLKNGHSTNLEDNPVDVEIKQEYDYFPKTEELQDFQEMKMSKSVEVEEIVGSSSSKYHKYEFKVKKPRFSIDLNQLAPDEDHIEFRVEMRDQKDRVKELQTMIMKLKQEKWMIEQWNAKQQEKLQKLKKKKKDQQALLKEVKEANIKLYWHNVVLKTTLKQRKTKGFAFVIQ